MELASLKCPNCGADADLDKNQDSGFCKYCGSKIIRKESIVQKVEIVNPIQIEGNVHVVNNEFEAKLAKVNRLAEEFWLKKNKSESEALSIIKDYQYLDNIGANESKLWESYLEFFVRVNLDDKLVICTNINTFKKEFYAIYNLILKYEQNIEILEKIKEKYDPQKMFDNFERKIGSLSFFKKHPVLKLFIIPFSITAIIVILIALLS